MKYNFESKPSNYVLAYGRLVEGVNDIEYALTHMGPEGEQDWHLYGKLLVVLREVNGVVREVGYRVEGDEPMAMTPNG